MSQKERRRVGIMTSVKAGELSLVEVSEVLGLSCRQAKRMWQRYLQYAKQKTLEFFERYCGHGGKLMLEGAGLSMIFVCEA